MGKGKGNWKRGAGGPPKKKGASAQLAKPVQSTPAPISTPPPRPVSADEDPVPAVGRAEFRTPLLDSLRVDNQLGSLPYAKAKRVPIVFRAQYKGRCQRQFVRQRPRDAIEWLDGQIYAREWRDFTADNHPYRRQQRQQETSCPRASATEAAAQCSTLYQEITINWRLISNSGIDDGFIRPVIGPGGWPLLPGSSIKGLFRRACTEQKDLRRWCGLVTNEKDMTAGILRFHGAWPKDASWKKNMLDITHPQYKWQVGFSIGDDAKNDHTAIALISLFKPRLVIGISSKEKLSETEWKRVEHTLESALQRGVGGRTASGYGRTGLAHGKPLFECQLEGQGSTPKLLDGTAEFRPTMFRAAIRSMALRLFGGITDKSTALKAVGAIFGAIGRDEGQHIGLLEAVYTMDDTRVDYHRCGTWSNSVFATSGCLQWRLAQSLDSHKRETLHDLLAALHGLTMSLGGFGRGWRRPCHRIFYPAYYEQFDEDDRIVSKSPIGCHWEWRKQESLRPGFILVKSPGDLIKLLHQSRKLAEVWLREMDMPLNSAAPWREVIHPARMLIWMREADDVNDAEVIHWFHKSPRNPQQDPRDLRKTDLAGKTNQVGRIWNRLLPIPSSEQGIEGHGRVGAWMKHSAGPFLESVVLFPEHQLSPAFIAMMDRGASTKFTRLRFNEQQGQ